MTSKEQAQRLQDELWRIINYHSREYPDVDMAQVMGILETIKMDLYIMARAETSRGENEDG